MGSGERSSWSGIVGLILAAVLEAHAVGVSASIDLSV